MLPTDIDNLTEEQLDQLIESEELKCKIDPKTGDVKCATTEDYFKALAKLKNQPKRIVFEITPEPAPGPAPEPVPE
ncbi:unnamed protein product [marine sediment metagenome]|uniref:Uncharacterized protein n=1 Tax=marine sediment metagenome TaxID=412755 RepID=X1JQI5_9ZZZZ